jgi:hypothetical protein
MGYEVWGMGKTEIFLGMGCEVWGMGKTEILLGMRYGVWGMGKAIIQNRLFLYTESIF